TGRDVSPDEAGFWRFVQRCFSQPRRTVKNNLLAGDFPVEQLPEALLNLRAQQMDKEQLLQLWTVVRKDAAGLDKPSNLSTQSE
ncbi:MAG: hypothetical protein M1549_01695, partial [Candidatus Dependentiae bacterium]|nr:hypothetical protein [Candidatus Dependentiae bacterium]